MAITIAAMFLAWPRGVKLVIRNHDTTAMRDIRVIVTGRSYRIGDLQPYESHAIHLQPFGESHIVLRYADAAGTPRSLTVDCYLESGCSGRIAVEVANGRVAKVDNQIRVAFW